MTQPGVELGPPAFMTQITIMWCRVPPLAIGSYFPSFEFSIEVH
jgi:hypothetical protein